MQPAAHLADRPVGFWRITREGAPVAVVNIQNERGQVVVAADVTERPTMEPYLFGTIEDADTFIGDLMTSFAYLGCDIARD